MGRAEDSRGIAKARDKSLGNNDCKLHGEASTAAVPILAHLLEKPHDDAGFSGFLRGSDDYL